MFPQRQTTANLDARSYSRRIGPWFQACASLVASQFSLALLFFALGLLVAATLHFTIFDPDVRSYITLTVTRSSVLSWIFRSREYAYLAAGSVALALIPLAIYWIKRLFNSWVHGAVNELALLSFLAAGLFVPSVQSSITRLVAGLTFVATMSLASHFIRSASTPRASSRIPEGGISDRHSQEVDLALAGTEDEPITDWEVDLLERRSLVEVIRTKLLILGKPVLVLDGKFGSGKTSVLNLLRLRLKDEAVVVFFSAWLPGSETTLAEFLLSDIATECNRQFIVPGLTKSTRRFVSALATSVPYLHGLTEFVSPTTQSEALNRLKAALRRVPKRVVVLIDELDRMQRNEILELLKLLRGVAGIANLSFVCACDTEQVIQAAGTCDGNANEARTYFEKFFLDVIPISEPSPEALEAIGTDRVVRTLKASGALKTEQEEQDCQSTVAKLWRKCFATYCCNLRKIGIVVNDLHGAMLLLERNVSYIDLALVTLLHRISPKVYELIAGERLILTGGFNGIKNYEYLDDKERAKREKRLAERVRELCIVEDERRSVEEILTVLFPVYPGFLGRVARDPGAGELEKSMKISNPWMFAAYFRLQLPKEVFGASALERFIKSATDATDIAEVGEVFGATLNTMEKGSDRREDFLWKISLSMNRLNPKISIWLARTIMRFADQYVYDSNGALWGESTFACRVAKAALAKLADGTRVQFLRDCLTEAGDDSMAYGLIENLTDLHLGDKAEARIPLATVWQAFTERMRSKYGPNSPIPVEAAFLTSAPGAFAIWGSANLSKWGINVVPLDRELLDDFWARYIGISRERLAIAYRGFFMPFGAYQSDPTAFVERQVSMALLRQFRSRVGVGRPDESVVTTKSLQRLDRFLGGAYRDGVPPSEWRDSTDDPPAESVAI